MLSKETEQYNQRSMDQRDLDRAHFLKNFQSLILQYDHIVIFHHNNPDGDCLGAAFGIKEIIQSNYPNKKAYVVGSNPNDVYSWLNMKFDNAINFHFDFGSALALIVDVGQSERIECFDRFFKDQRLSFGAVVKIDHHDCISDFHVDLTWDDPTYVSSCEQIIQIADYYGWLITPKAATALYLGCVTDSLGFSVSGVSPRSFVLAAKALRAGADANEVQAKTKTRTWNQFDLSRYLMNKAVATDHVIYGVVTEEEIKRFNVPSPKSLVNIYRNIENLWIWMMAVEKGDILEISIRSMYASARDLANRYGGGGHEYAAGCKIKKEQFEALIHDANVIVAAAKQERYYESTLRGEDPDPEEVLRTRDAVVRKNPEVIEEAKKVLEEVKKDREDGTYDSQHGRDIIEEKMGTKKYLGTEK